MKKDLRVRIARCVSCKVALAARVDSFHQSPHGEKGREFLNEIEKRLEKLEEPPPVKAIKALPPPIEPSKKKRGGRRERKRKEREGTEEGRKEEEIMGSGFRLMGSREPTGKVSPSRVMLLRKH